MCCCLRNATGALGRIAGRGLAFGFVKATGEAAGMNTNNQKNDKKTKEKPKEKTKGCVYLFV
jgi:hypothetical protein